MAVMVINIVLLIASNGRYGHVFDKKVAVVLM